MLSFLTHRWSRALGAVLFIALVFAGCKGAELPPHYGLDTGGGDTDTVDHDTDVEADCDNLPAPGISYTIIDGIKASEDFAFDDDGNAIGENGGNLFKSTYDGFSEMFMPGAGGFIAGLRALPSGDMVYSDVNSGTIFRVDKDTAQKTEVLSGLQYSNGIEIGLDGFIYTAEQNAGAVRRIDPGTGEFNYVAQGLNNPNGLSFSPDYETLYVGSFGGGTIWKVEIDSEGNGGSVEVFASGVGTGSLDGMGVDACGNVYVCDYGQIHIFRISPDDPEHPVDLVNLSADSSWIPNFQWGSGIGGWKKDHIYVLDMGYTRAYEVPVGVPGKYRPYP